MGKEKVIGFSQFEFKRLGATAKCDVSKQVGKNLMTVLQIKLAAQVSLKQLHDFSTKSNSNNIFSIPFICNGQREGLIHFLSLSSIDLLQQRNVIIAKKLKNILMTVSQIKLAARVSLKQFHNFLRKSDSNQRCSILHILSGQREGLLHFLTLSSTDLGQEQNVAIENSGEKCDNCFRGPGFLKTIYITS